MRLSTRRLLDRVFSATGVLSLLFMVAALCVILGPILYRGSQAFVFRETVERRKMMLEHFQRGNPEKVEAERAEVRKARGPIYRPLRAYEEDLSARENQLASRLLELREEKEGAEPEVEIDWAKAAKMSPQEVKNLLQEKRAAKKKGKKPTAEIEKKVEAVQRQQDVLEEERERFERIKDLVRKLLGPLPWDEENELPRAQYGETRWDRTLVARREFLYRTEYVSGEAGQMREARLAPRAEEFEDTPLKGLFAHVKDDANLRDMLRPRWTFYWRFLFDDSVDAHFFGGIWPAVLGTLYLTFGAMVVAAPVGVISAIYLTEYAGDGVFISLLRTCISTLAGVPSVVFGLFGLAFFILTVGVSDGKSVLVGSLTLALLILPTIIRASEEALRAVPRTYKEASLSLGATKWRTIVKVVLPAALPGIITSIIISMGRAAGETAPILFTWAVAMGPALKPWEALSQPTPALTYSIYSLVSEHQAVEQIRHVQYGMVTTLLGLVLLLNLAAIILRARVARKLRG